MSVFAGKGRHRCSSTRDAHQLIHAYTVSQVFEWLIASDGQVDAQRPQPMQVSSFTCTTERPVLKQFEEIC
jgi:hypothetical protein